MSENTNHDGYTIKTEKTNESDVQPEFIWKVFKGENNLCKDEDKESFIEESATTFNTDEEATDDAKGYIDIINEEE